MTGTAKPQDLIILRLGQNMTFRAGAISILALNGDGSILTGQAGMRITRKKEFINFPGKTGTGK
ncbi:hypothetical protein D3C81_2209960 [compost metagenome]